MALEGIHRRPYPEADRNEVQERIASAIEADPEPFFARYRTHAQSFEAATLLRSFQGNVPRVQCVQRGARALQ